MVQIEVNRRFRHASGNDFDVKDNVSSRLKEAIFDITFDDVEGEYARIGTTSNRGVILDFSRWFASLIAVEDLHSSSLHRQPGSGNLPIQRHIPVFTVVESEEVSPLPSGHAFFELFSAQSGEERDQADTNTDDDNDAGTAEADIRGNTITVRVTGY